MLQLGMGIRPVAVGCAHVGERVGGRCLYAALGARVERVLWRVVAKGDVVHPRLDYESRIVE